jgi:hypothetical protein
MSMRTRFTSCAVVAIGLLAVCARACEVPVFRYALERWEADAYPVWVFHRGVLKGDANAAAAYLRERAAARDVTTNVDPRTLDVTRQADSRVGKIWKEHSKSPLPLMVVCYPPRHGSEATAWAAPLTAENARRLTDSPARREIARRILGGQTAVWVLLQSGDAAKDAAAGRMLNETSRRLEKEIELPQQVREEWSSELLATEEPGARPDRARLRVEFSVLPVSRQDANEAFLVGSLTGSEEDLRGKYAGEVMAFAVFGQGRMLPALVGKGITAENIAEVAAFLCGRCSCEIKDQNPGMDLLMTTDWAALRDEPAVAPPLPSAIAAPTTSIAAKQGAVEAPSPSMLWYAVGAVGGVVVLGAVIAVVLARRSSKGAV